MATRLEFLLIAAVLLPLRIASAQADETDSRCVFRPLDFEIKLDTVLQHDDGKFLWFHPRVAAIPSIHGDGPPEVIMTLQKHLRTSDHYSGLSVMRTSDLGKSWTEPDPRPELDWIRESNGVDITRNNTGWRTATGCSWSTLAETRQTITSSATVLRYSSLRSIRTSFKSFAEQNAS